jgi:pyridoxine 5-phosphate synthase
MQTRLSVNLNKVALIRNSRGGNNPDLIRVAKDCEAFGAEGITIHPRPDQRHARYSDISTLKAVVTTELNVEGYPTPELWKWCWNTGLISLPWYLIHREFTSSEGWAIKEQASFLKIIVPAEKRNSTSCLLSPHRGRRSG